MKHLLDPKLGGKIRAVLLLVAAVGSVAAASANDIAAGGGVISVPVVLSILAHFTKLGNKDA